MLRSLSAAALLAALALTVTAAEPKKYDKPEDAFDAMNKAMKDRKWDEVYDVLTPESGEKMLGGILIMTGTFKQFAKLDSTGKLAEKLEPITKAIEKAGVKDSDIEDALKSAAEKKGDAKAMAEVTKKLVEPVKEKGKLLGEVMNEMEALNPKKQDIPEAKVKDVKIDGDTATGTTVTKRGDKDEESPVTFKKIDKGWRVELPDGLFNKGPKGGKDKNDK